MKRSLYILSLVCVLLSSCKDEMLSTDPNLKLAFSVDSLCFDTVFTGMGSSTQLVMVYNPNKRAVEIEHVGIESPYFQLNLDGENDPQRLHNITLNGGDSLYLFVRVNIPEQHENSPVLIIDTIRFLTNGNRQGVHVEAYGQDVWRIRSKGLRCDTAEVHFLADKPYLIYDTMVVSGTCVIDAGATLYMHHNASLYCYGGLTALGNREQPIRITGDRLDKLFAHVPYQVASGQWGGVYLVQKADEPLHRDSINYVDILSGNVGLYAMSEDGNHRAHISIGNARIHNHAAYGIVLLNTDADIYNSEISNCASYCVYLHGGEHHLTHNTIASYFGWPYTNLNIHNVGRDDVAALYLSNSKEDTVSTTLWLRNCIITGARKQSISYSDTLREGQIMEATGNYLRCDTLPLFSCHDNVYASDTDTVFRNIYYRYKEYNYYDFHLDSISPARACGMSNEAGHPWDTDRDGQPRPIGTEQRPDAGCYQRNEECLVLSD